MADPIQTARIVEAMAKAIKQARGQCGDHSPHCDDVLAQAALSTAFPMIREEMAKIAAAEIMSMTDLGQYRHPIKNQVATAIRTTELPLAEKERE